MTARTSIRRTGKGGMDVAKRLTAKRAGFTLLEMLVVIGIMTIVASIVVPALFNARKKARLVECTNNLSQIGISLQMYAQANGDHYPIWPDPSRPEFSKGSFDYALDATNVLQWSAADSPNLVNEKIGLGCLYPEFLGDSRVFNEPADPGHKLPVEALIDEERGVSQDLTLRSGYVFVNGDFEIEMTRGPIGLGWLGFKTSEPVAWCAKNVDETRFPHENAEMNCLYMDGHVKRILAPDGQPDDFIVRPLVPWTMHEVINTIKEVSGTFNQDYPP